jgi:dTMP kinase
MKFRQIPVFIVVEGLDGTGKSTLAKELSSILDAELLRTPPDEFTDIRNKIDQTYWECGLAAQLFYGSTVAFTSKKVQKFLQRGHSVVVDRYWLSTHAYARCRDESLDLAEVIPMLKKPDMTIMLYLDEITRLKRIKIRGMSKADMKSFDQHKQLREAYMQALTLPITGKVLKIDTSYLTPEQCAGLVVEELQRS